MAALSEKALLVSVQVRQWGARKTDKVATNTVIREHKTERAAGAYTKRLLPKSSELDAIASIASRIRKDFYQRTLPWNNDGLRIMPSRNYSEFIQNFQTLKGEFDSAVEAFIQKYPDLVVEAEKVLGELFQPRDYPSQWLMTSKFECSVKVLPMPDERDFRVEISESEREEFRTMMASTEASAMKDCWERLYEVVEKTKNRLTQPESNIRQSMIDSALEICSILPNLNISEDANLESSRLEVERVLSSLDVESLKDNTVLKKEAAEELADITAKMSAFMGA